MDKVVDKFLGFKNWYFFVVLIFSGLATNFYRDIGGNLLLFFLTIIYAVIYKIDFKNKNLFVVIIIWLCFSIITAFRNFEFLPWFTFRHIIRILICFTLIQLYGKKLFVLFEYAVFLLACFSLVVWLLQVVFPSFVFSLFRPLNISHYHTFFENGSYFIIGGVLSQDTLLPRNYGFCWEPGPFSVYLVLALFFNVLRYRGKWNNKIFYLLFLTLLTTQSTTGYLAFMCGALIYVYQYYKGLLKYFVFIILAFLLVFLFYNTSFLYDKIQELYVDGLEIDTVIRRGVKTETSYSGGRFGGFIIAWEDIKKYPLFGTGGFWGISYGKGYVYIVNGLASIMSVYGLFGIIIFFLSLYKSSNLFANIYNSRLNRCFLFIVLFASVGFGVVNQSILFSFILMGWLYPLQKIRI